jgi:hypothetical protein
MNSSYLDANTYGVGQLLFERQLFAVPDHQREYAWGTDLVEQFLEDILSSLAEYRADYFLGLIVLVRPNGSEPWTILDGQQRLATATMVYSAIRQWLSNEGFEKDAVQIGSQYIGLTELGSEDDRPRIRMNVANRQSFEELVVRKASQETLDNRRTAAGRFSSDRLLVEAIITCRKYVREFARSAGQERIERAQALYRLAKYLRDQCQIVCLDVPDAANAYRIFESLNDRGEDLSALDLVKNHMFGLAGDRLQEVQTEWIRMTTELGDTQRDDFLKVFWTSRYGRIQRGRLFDSWKKEFEEQSKIVTLAPGLTLAARRYSALHLPDDDVWADYSSLFKSRLGILADLGNQQIRAILLAAIDVLDAEQMERLVGHLITLTVRYQVVGKRRTGALEITSARVARGISEKDLDTPAKIWNALSGIVPTDVEFESDFALMSETNSLKARYLLAELEKIARRMKYGAHGAELAADYRALTLEHVLPRNPAPDWNEVLKTDSELRTRYTYRLGNMGLLTEQMNRKLASSGFEEKRKAIYAESTLELTRMLNEVAEDWDRSAIELRQSTLSELAVEAWPLPQV